MGYLLDSKASLGYQLGVFSFFFFLLPFLVWLGGDCTRTYHEFVFLVTSLSGILMLVSLDSALV